MIKGIEIEHESLDSIDRSELRRDVRRWITRAIVWQGIAHTIRCLPHGTYDIAKHLDDLSDIELYLIYKDETLLFANDNDNSIIMSLNVSQMDPCFACETMEEFLMQYLF